MPAESPATMLTFTIPRGLLPEQPVSGEESDGSARLLMKDTAGTARQKAKRGQDERIDVLQPQLDD
jgi:hypothetical protein